MVKDILWVNKGVVVVIVNFRIIVGVDISIGFFDEFLKLISF